MNGYDPATMNITGNTRTDAGDYTVSVTSKTYKWADGSADAVTAAWKIGKANQEAPNGLIGVAPTTEGGGDGKITGVTDKMEYRAATGSNYMACPDGEITGLSADTYFVRYAEDRNHFASSDAAVTVGNGEPLADCTITFNAGDGSGIMASVTVKDGSNYILPSCGFTAPDDQEFKAWEIGGTEYGVGDSYTVDRDTEIKALWENSVITPTACTVTVTSGGNGKASADSVKAVAGTEIKLTAKADSGYHFKEWQVVKGGVTIQGNKFTMPGENVEIKAIFEKNTSTGPIGTGTTTYPITVMENYAKVKLRPSTFKTSQGFLKNHIKPQIGGIPLAELTSLDLQRFYKHLLDGGRVDRIEAKKKPKGLASKTVRNIHQMIGSAYNLAMEQKLVTRNPTQGCALPKVEHKEMKTLTADQLSAFFQEARDSGVYELYYLDLATGLRRGELLGLKWTDVDFQHGVLKIQRAISRQNGKVVEAPLKTKNAYRTLPLSADAIDVLKMQKCKAGNSEWAFPSPSGGPMSPDSVLHMLQRVLKRAGLPRIRFHDLRHTFATMALQNGVDVKTVSSMLGHYSAGFTLDTYAHVTTDAQLKAAQTMGNILSRAV